MLTGKGCFSLIEVKNAFVGEVVFRRDGLPVTTKKEDIPMHGIGLSNVRQEAEKYIYGRIGIENKSAGIFRNGFIAGKE